MKYLNLKKVLLRYCNTKYAIGCANGTDALTIALKSVKSTKKF